MFRLSMLVAAIALFTAAPLPAALARQPDPEPAPRRVAVSADEVVRGQADQPRLSLVINAGAGYEPAPEMLDVLAERRVRTTFFLLGWWAERNPDLVRRMQADGHEIASHGHSVFDLTAVSDEAVAADLERADAAISAITGQTTSTAVEPLRRLPRRAGARHRRPARLPADPLVAGQRRLAHRCHRRPRTAARAGGSRTRRDHRPPLRQPPHPHDDRRRPGRPDRHHPRPWPGAGHYHGTGGGVAARRPHPAPAAFRSRHPP
ncbi:MAG: polysaccharide deacetylase family protein [Dehalococcoidia bacterium]